MYTEYFNAEFENECTYSDLHDLVVKAIDSYRSRNDS